MSPKSHLLGLMAKKEAAQLAGVRKTLTGIAKERRAAEAMEEKISSLLDARKSAQLGTMSANELRGARHLADQLAAEAFRLKSRVVELTQQEAEASRELNQKDHKLRSLKENAMNARAVEQAEREARAEAARANMGRRNSFR